MPNQLTEPQENVKKKKKCNLCSSFSQEFELTKFKLELSVEELIIFADSPIIGLKRFQVYRCIVACYFICLFIWTWGEQIQSGETGYYWIYLTNWTLVLETHYLVFAAIISLQMPKIRDLIHQSLRSGPDGKLTVPRLVKSTWVLQNLVFCTSIVVVLLYWILEYKPGDYVSATNPQEHGLTGLVMLVDVTLSGAPHRVLHFYFPSVFAVAYTAWSLIFTTAKMHTANGDRFIYGNLNWVGNPQGAATIVILVIFVVIPCIQVLLWWFVHIIKSTCRRENEQWTKGYLLGGANNDSEEGTDTEYGRRFSDCPALIESDGHNKLSSDDASVIV